MRTGPGQAAQREKEGAKLLSDTCHRPQGRDPAAAGVEHYCHQILAKQPILDKGSPTQPVTQPASGHGNGRGSSDRRGPPGGLPDPVLDGRLLDDGPLGPGVRLGGLWRTLVPQLGVDGAQSRQVFADLVEGWRFDSEQGGGSASLHPVQRPPGRAIPDDDVQADETQLCAVTGGECPKFHGWQDTAMPCEVGQAAPAMRQRLAVTVTQPGSEPALVSAAMAWRRRPRESASRPVTRKPWTAGEMEPRAARRLAAARASDRSPRVAAPEFSRASTVTRTLRARHAPRVCSRNAAAAAVEAAIASAASPPSIASCATRSWASAAISGTPAAKNSSMPRRAAVAASGSSRSSIRASAYSW